MQLLAQNPPYNICLVYYVNLVLFRCKCVQFLKALVIRFSKYFIDPHNKIQYKPRNEKHFHLRNNTFKPAFKMYKHFN